MNEITKEVRNILLSNADRCINELDEFHVPEEVLDEIALRIIPMDSFVLTDSFERGGDEGFDIFIQRLSTFIFEDHKPYEVPLIKDILLARLRESVEAMCDDFEPDVREAIEEHQKEVKAERTSNLIMSDPFYTPFHLQMKILGDGMDRILGTGDKK